jgi:hypothetical protein
MTATKIKKIWTKKNKEQVLSLFKEGVGKSTVLCFLGVSRDTFYNWLKKDLNSCDKECVELYKNFQETIKQGEAASQSWWEEKGRNNLDNRDFNTPLYNFNMKNMFRRDYGDEQKIELKGDLSLNLGEKIKNAQKRAVED